MNHSLLFDYKKTKKQKKPGIGFSAWSACFSFSSGRIFFFILGVPPPAGWRRFSQVNLSFWSVGGGGGGRELGGGHAQGHLLQGAVLTGVVTAVGIGTARGGEA